jgi:phage gp29-like protein
MGRSKRQAARQQARRETTANTAPPRQGSEPLTVSAEALRTVRQNRWNPLPYLQPQVLSRCLDNFEHGYLRETALLWERIANHDDTLASVKPKREKAVSQLDMQVVTLPGGGDEAEAHKDVLQRFWSNVRAVNHFDRNEKGGFRRLVKQMMTAVSFRYAAHHIIWEPRPDGELRATFEFVPLWMFENRTGRLRYVASAGGVEGETLTPGEWMVTVGDGLMIACSIGYLGKRACLQDWLAFSEKFSMPGVLGVTAAAKDSPEGQAMKAATEAFGHDWNAVIYGADGQTQDPIRLIAPNGNPSAMPMPALVERVDRKMAALYRGADLSTMSSGGGEGTGASLQGEEGDLLLRDDAETVAETLEEVSRLVIEWHFGNGTEPQARVELVVPVQEDAKAVIDSAVALADRGAEISVSGLMDRANLPKATDAADALGKAPAPSPFGAMPGLPEGLANAITGRIREAVANADAAEAAELPQPLRAARAEGLRQIGEALAAGLDDPAKLLDIDWGALLAMPDFEDALGVLLAEAYVGKS